MGLREERQNRELREVSSILISVGQKSDFRGRNWHKGLMIDCGIVVIIHLLATDYPVALHCLDLLHCIMTVFYIK